MKTIVKYIFVAFFQIILWQNSNAQCALHTIVNEGFEYNTPCPNAIPNIAYTLVPQSYQVHSGATSLYLNFKDYVSATNTGTNAGDTVYIRKVAVCANVPMQVSAWLRTTFSGGTPCNMHLTIADKNNNILANTDSMALPFPTWVQYLSGLVTPTTDTIKFILITNVAGGNGNDLSIDDLLVEQCSGMISGGIAADTSTCNNQTIQILARNGFVNYLWNDSLAAQLLFITNNTPGADTVVYTVTFNDTMNCAYSDTMTIYFEDCTNIQTLNTKNNISIYPNPSQGNVTIVGELSSNNATIRLFDVVGKPIITTKINSQLKQVNFAQIATGTYFYALYDGEIVVARGKLIIN